jgi:hypothetical protein
MVSIALSAFQYQQEKFASVYMIYKKAALPAILINLVQLLQLLKTGQRKWKSVSSNMSCHPVKSGIARCLDWVAEGLRMPRKKIQDNPVFNVQSPASHVLTEANII